MDIESIKDKVNNYEFCSADDIEEILNFIAERKKQELGIDFEFEVIYDTGAFVSNERTIDRLQQVAIGYQNIRDMKEYKEMKQLADAGQIDFDIEIPEISPIEERKEFIELILATFHELRHVKQKDNIQDHPILNEETQKWTREMIINDSFPGFSQSFNYEQSMMEIDAMRASLEETVEFFKEMKADITPDEVFAVMREKELPYLSYDLQNFGDSYDTALTYLNQIYGKTTEIKGIEDIIESLPDDKKKILYGECQELLDGYYSETDMENKMELLKQISLRMTPELKEEYPLTDIQAERSEETGFILNTVNGKKVAEIPDTPQRETGFRLSSVNGKAIEQLTTSYKNAGICKSDLNNALTILSETKKERENTLPQIKDNKFESR